MRSKFPELPLHDCSRAARRPESSDGARVLNKDPVRLLGALGRVYTISLGRDGMVAGSVSSAGLVRGGFRE